MYQYKRINLVLIERKAHSLINKMHGQLESIKGQNRPSNTKVF